MFKACSKCGKIHSSNYVCNVRNYNNSDSKEKKLRSQYSWTEKSKQIREDANHLCEVCRDQGIFTYDKIEVHHITKVKDDESRLLDDENLISLCAPHHKQADNNELDKDYLIELARKRISNRASNNFKM